MKNYDLIVIGAGPAGYVGAIRAAKLGKSVALVEKQDVGGTCLNRGCIPTKTLVHTAGLVHELSTNADLLGISTGAVFCDTHKLAQRRDDVVCKLRDGIAQLLKANKITVYNCKATLDADKTVVLEGVAEEKISGENILIATGSVPAVPPIPGVDTQGVVTSNDLLEGDFVDCKSLVIVGGGVIGVEFASIYSSLGCQVTVLEGLPSILPNLDTEISRSLAMSLKKRGVNICAGAMVEAISGADGKLCVSYSVREKCCTVEAETVLIATGRKANTKDLFAPGMSVGMERGCITVDENFRTTADGVYAVGDVMYGSCQLAHAASAQAVNAVCAMFGLPFEKNTDYVPSCIYTEPEVACVGLTEAQAKKQGIEVKTGKFSTLSNGKSVIVNAQRGFVKLVFSADCGKLLGAQLMCERATDMIGGLTAALCSGLTQEQLSCTVWPHPTFSESVGEAADDAGSGAIHSVRR